MSRSSLATRFLASLDDLRAHPAVSLLFDKKATALLPEQQEELAGDLAGSPFAKQGASLTELLALPLNVRLGWEYQLDGRFEMGGLIHLSNPAGALTACDYDVSYVMSRKADQGRVVAKYIGDVDRSDESLPRNTGAIVRADPERDRLDVSFLLAGTEYPTSLDIHGYVEALSLTKGFDLWPLLFCDTLPADLVASLTHEEQTWARMLAALPRLFPALDYTPLQQRYAKLT